MTGAEVDEDTPELVVDVEKEVVDTGVLPETAQVPVTVVASVFVIVCTFVFVMISVLVTVTAAPFGRAKTAGRTKRTVAAEVENCMMQARKKGSQS